MMGNIRNTLQWDTLWIKWIVVSCQWTFCSMCVVYSVGIPIFYWRFSRSASSAIINNNIYTMFIALSFVSVIDYNIPILIFEFSLFYFHFQQNHSNTNGCIRIGKMDHIILVKCKPDLSQTEIDSQFKKAASLKFLASCLSLQVHLLI